MPKCPAVNIAAPINRANKLMDGLVSRWKVLPFGQWAGGTQFKDLCRVNDGTLSATGPPVFLGAGGRQGGYGAIDFSPNAQSQVTHIQPFTAVSAFSVAAWIRFPSAPADTDSYWGKWDESGNTQQFVRWNGGTSQIQWFVRNSANTTNANTNVATSAATVSAWNFLVGTADGTNLNFYLFNSSGTLTTNSTALTGPYIPTDSVLWKIGWGRTQGGRHLHDEHMYWSRSLSQTEAVQVWIATRSPFDPTLNWYSRPAVIKGAAAATGSSWYYNHLCGGVSG